jgi:DnaK suppressor protein
MPNRKKPAGKKAASGKSRAKKTGAVKKKTPAKKAKAVKKSTKKIRAVSRPVKASGKKTGSTGRKKSAKSMAGKITETNRKLKTVSRRAREKEKFVPYQAKHGEEYMGPAQTEHFRQILLKWKRELMEEVDRTVHHMRDEAANFPDPNDRATQEEEFALELRTRDRERKLIRKIDESLMALDSGDYGYCEICGVEIGIRRLEARPAATLCIDCKTLDEIKERHMG